MKDIVFNVLRIISVVLVLVFTTNVEFSIPIQDEIIKFSIQCVSFLVICSFIRPIESVVGVAFFGLLVYLRVITFNDNSGVIAVTENLGYLIGLTVSGLVISWIRHPYRKESFLSIGLLLIIGFAIILVSMMIDKYIIAGYHTSVNDVLIKLWKNYTIQAIIGSIIGYILHLMFRLIFKHKV